VLVVVGAMFGLLGGFEDFHWVSNWVGRTFGIDAPMGVILPALMVARGLVLRGQDR
jgi:hypothetical protein